MKLVEIEGHHIPLLSVRDMMEVTEIAWHEERRMLCEDLDTSKASPETRLSALQEHTKRRGTALVLIYATMRLDIAQKIIERACKTAGVDIGTKCSAMTPADMIRKAQSLLGYELEEGTESGKS